MTTNTNADLAEDLQDTVSKALRLAWQLGQTYWQQADSEYTSQHRKADETQGKFDALVEETRAALSTAAQGGEGGEEDAARLDWLESNAQITIERLRCIGSGKRVYEVVASNDAEIYGEGDTLRAAIDAARGAQGESK